MPIDSSSSKINLFRNLNIVEVDNSKIKLAPKEFELLELLANHYPHPVSKETIISTIWDNKTHAEELLTRLVADLRKKLGDSPRSPRYIETVVKKGYRLITAAQFSEIETLSVKTKKKSKYSRPSFYLPIFLVMFVLFLVFTEIEQPANDGTQIRIQEIKKNTINW